MRSGYPFPTDEIDPWTNQGDNLAWVAFRYVADELAPDLADQFERRLLDDQGAREAVASAVDTLGACGIVARDQSSSLVPVAVAIASRSIRTSRTPWWIPASLAASLLLGLIGWRLVATKSDEAPNDSVSVARAWTNLRDQLTPGDGSVPVLDPTATEGLATTENGANDNGNDNDVEVTELPAERPLPSWMVAAVAPEPDSESPILEEN